MGGASRRPRPTGVMVHGGRAATRGRPYGQIGTFQGGRVRTPAPTKYGELSGLFVGAGPRPARKRGIPLPCGMAWAAHPGGRALRALWSTEGGRVRTPAPAKYGDLSGLSVGAGHWPARRRPLAAHLIRPLRGHLPLKGKAFGRLIAAPTVHRKPVGAHSMRPPEFAPGALVRKRQARERNRTSPNFPPTQAPSGAGRDRTQSLLILHAGNFLAHFKG